MPMNISELKEKIIGQCTTGERKKGLHVSLSNSRAWQGQEEFSRNHVQTLFLGFVYTLW